VVLNPAEHETKNLHQHSIEPASDLHRDRGAILSGLLV